MLHLYHKLPYPARSVAASLHGYYLASQRYGGDGARLAAECAERDAWPADRWKKWREERLAFLLQRAVTRVPFYREMWARRRARGDSASWRYLENWPVLDRTTVRQNAEAFVADDRDRDGMIHDLTSGTTGAPLNVWFTRQTLRHWYALFEVRLRSWNGLSRQDRWAMLGGREVAPISRRQPPFWVWNQGFRQLYLSTYHLAPDLIRHYLEAMRQHRVGYMLGYTSSLYALACGAIQSGWNGLELRVALTNAEPVFDFQRRKIREAFRCPVRETYGMVEMAAAASECEHGSLHAWPEAGHMEVFDADVPVRGGVTGDLVCTGLLNADMPLIRYRIGDRGALAPCGTECPCGRNLPLVQSIEGRTSDLLYTADGRQLSPNNLEIIFESGFPVEAAQVIQESLSRVRVLCVPEPSFNAAVERDIRRAVSERLGIADVRIERVKEIPRGANGKARAVVCSLSVEEREKALAGC